MEKRSGPRRIEGTSSIEPEGREQFLTWLPRFCNEKIGGAKALSSQVGNLSSAESAAPPNAVPPRLHHTLRYPRLRPKLCATQRLGVHNAITALVSERSALPAALR